MAKHLENWNLVWHFVDEGYEIWSWQDLLDAVAEGEIKDSATNIAVLRAQHKYGREIQDRLS